MDPMSALSAVGAGSNLVLRLVQGGYQYASVPEDIEQLLLGLENFDETIKTTRTLRRIKSHLMDEREKANVDRVIDTSSSVLQSIRQTVESCRKDLATKDRVTAKSRLLWLVKDHDAFVARGWTVSTCMQNLTIQITRMSLLQQPTVPPKHFSNTKGVLRPPQKRVMKQTSNKSLSTERSYDIDNRSIPSTEWNGSTLTLAQHDGPEQEDVESVRSKETKDKDVVQIRPSHAQVQYEDLPEVVVPPFLESQSIHTIQPKHQPRFYSQKIHWQQPQPGPMLTYTSQKPVRQHSHGDSTHNPWSQEISNVKFVELPGSDVPSSNTGPPLQSNQIHSYSHSQPPMTPAFPHSSLSPPPLISPLSSPPPYSQISTRSPPSSIDSVTGQEYSSISHVTSGNHSNGNITAPPDKWRRHGNFGSTLSHSISSGNVSGIPPLSPKPKRRLKSMFIT